MDMVIGGAVGALILGEPIDNRATTDIAAWVARQNLFDFPLSGETLIGR